MTISTICAQDTEEDHMLSGCSRQDHQQRNQHADAQDQVHQPAQDSDIRQLCTSLEMDEFCEQKNYVLETWYLAKHPLLLMFLPQHSEGYWWSDALSSTGGAPPQRGKLANPAKAAIQEHWSWHLIIIQNKIQNSFHVIPADPRWSWESVFQPVCIAKLEVQIAVQTY